MVARVLTMAHSSVLSRLPHPEIRHLKQKPPDFVPPTGDTKPEGLRFQTLKLRRRSFRDALRVLYTKGKESRPGGLLTA